MPLPKLVVPEYECELPSTGETVKYRPFLVKEEKIILMAMESNSEKDMMNAVKSIIRNCTSIKRKIDALPTFDIEFLFLRIRAKSAGEEADVIITAPDDGETEIKIKVPLEEVACEKPEGHNPKIMLDDDTGVVMTYPSLDTFVKENISGAATESDSVDQVFSIAAGCISQIFQGEEVWEAKDCTKKELTEFLESLTNDQFIKLQSFFETMPKLQWKTEVTNPETKVKSEVVLEGLSSFFG